MVMYTFPYLRFTRAIINRKKNFGRFFKKIFDL